MYKDLLSLLAVGLPVSGQQLSDSLGVSRTSIWKRIEALRALGVPIEAVRGRGYQIPGGLQLLDAHTIKRLLGGSARSLASELTVLQSVGSTNTYLSEAARQGAGSGRVCLAEHQTEGRGRHGRQWISPFGRNIYMSTLWEYGEGTASLEGLSLAVGVAVKRAIVRTAAVSVSLKWPNDILLDDCKAGGVLLELLGDPNGLCRVVVGIGLNLGMPAGTEIDQPWSDLASEDPPDRNQLAAALIDELLPLLNTYAQQGFGAFREEWAEADAFRDEEVTLITAQGDIRGKARGVSTSGALRLEVEGAVREYSGGELSLRRVP